MAFGGRSQMKMSDQTFDFVCTACERLNKTIEAVKYCVECSGYCCQSCTDIHKTFPTLIGHNLTDISQTKQASSQQPVLTEFPTERCSVHRSKVIDMYCEHHDVVGCIICFAKDHKSCQDSHIHSVPDMIDTLFKLSDCKQTHGLLKDMIVSMETQNKNEDSQLQALNKAKKETLDKVTTFQKALEAILRKVADSSRNQVENAFKKLEKEILHEKRSIKNICDDLQTTNDKLSKSEGNRAQRFVCTKMAKEKMKAAGRELKKVKYFKAGGKISFTPNQSVMEYMIALQSIGQVQEVQSNHHYKIKGRADINLKLSDDSKTCSSDGCCLTLGNQLIVTDYNNKKLKRVDLQKMSVVDYCTLNSYPYGVCCISKHEVAVACIANNKIQFVSIHNDMTLTRHIDMSHACYGIAFSGDKLYVTNFNKALYVYDMAGTLLKTISHADTGRKLFNLSRHVTFNEIRNRLFVGDWDDGVVCFDGMGNNSSSIKDDELRGVCCVCVDGRGNMFVLGCTSHNVIQFSEDGKKYGVVVDKKDGINSPSSACFHQEQNRLFVTAFNNNLMKMYELE